MSEMLACTISDPSTSFAEVSPAKTSQGRGKGRGSPGRVQGSGTSSLASSASSPRAPLSLKTSRPVPGVGCPSCGEICTCWGTEPVPSRFLPLMSGRRTCESGSSLLRWATPCARDDRGPSTRAARHSGACLPSQVGETGKLNHMWVEALMGFPCGWVSLPLGAPSPTPGSLRALSPIASPGAGSASERSEMRLSRNAPK